MRIGAEDLTIATVRGLADYYPVWLDDLAGDVILEGSAMDGLVQGAEAVRTVLVSIRALYDYQEFNSIGPTARTAGSTVFYTERTVVRSTAVRGWA